MTDIGIAAIEKLETLAAWHRFNADHSDSDWVWEMRVRAAEELERQAADLRAQRSRAVGQQARRVSRDQWPGGNAAFQGRAHGHADQHVGQP